MRGNCYQDSKDIIFASPMGMVFAKADFEKFGSDDVLRHVLSRLVQEGILRKVLPSVYYRPVRFKGWEDCIGPNAYDVAYARARNCGWKIVASPALAMYHFGLTEQTPEKFEFWSSGNIFYHKQTLAVISISSTVRLDGY